MGRNIVGGKRCLLRDVQHALEDFKIFSQLFLESDEQDVVDTPKKICVAAEPAIERTSGMGDLPHGFPGGIANLHIVRRQGQGELVCGAKAGEGPLLAGRPRDVNARTALPLPAVKSTDEPTYWFP